MYNKAGRRISGPDGEEETNPGVVYSPFVSNRPQNNDLVVVFNRLIGMPTEDNPQQDKLLSLKKWCRLIKVMRKYEQAILEKI